MATFASVWHRFVVACLLFLLALFPRLTPAWQGYITPDEPFWVFSSIRFWRALQTRQWLDTFQIGHPGVTTMWAGTLGIWWQQWREPAATAEHLAWIEHVPWIAPENIDLFPHLAPFLPPARVAMAVLTSLGLVGIYLLASRLLGHRLALAGATLIALDPFLIGLSGLLHVDALASTFAALSLLGWLVALRGSSDRSSDLSRFPPTQRQLLSQVLLALFSGLCAGLGILSKSVAIFLVAAVGAVAPLWIAWGPAHSNDRSSDFSRFRRRASRFALLGCVWALGAIVATVAAFPAMWVDPLGTLQRIYGLVSRYGAESHRISFFRGIAGGNPGPFFYPIVLLFRLTPVTLVGLVLSLLALIAPVVAALVASVRPSRARAAATPAASDRPSPPRVVATFASDQRSSTSAQQSLILVSLWIFVIGFVPFIALGAKKIDRYLLPVFPIIDLLAGIGWLESARWLVTLLRRPRQSTVAGQSIAATFASGPPVRAYAAILFILLLSQGVVILAGWPYYLDAYNPLAGGMRSALSTLPVGWGEGLEQVAVYLNRQPDVTERFVATGSPVLFGSLFRGQVLMLNESSRLLADHILITAIDRQVDPQQVAALISGAHLAYTAHAGGQEIAWLYDTDYRAEAEYLAHYAAPGDIVICDAPSPFARQGAAGKTAWNVHSVAGADEAELVAMLNDWSQSHTRLWYLAYPSGPASTSPRSSDVSHSDPTDMAYDTAHPAASPITASAIRHQLETYALNLGETDLGHLQATLYILPDQPIFAPVVSQSTQPAAGQPVVAPLVAPAFQPANFDQLAIVGGTLLDQRVTADSGIHFRLRWLATSTPASDYAPFIHLVDEAGHLRTSGRGDDLLVDERFWPTSTWTPGQKAELNYSLDLPLGLPPGRYWVVVGLADARTGRWLPALDAEHRIVGMTANVLSVQVGPADQPPDRPTAAAAATHYSLQAASYEANQLELLGYQHPAQVTVGATWIVELGWHALRSPEGDYSLQLALRTDGSEIAYQKTFPLSSYPTSRWRSGEFIHELVDVTLPPELQAGSYTLVAQVRDALGVPLAEPVSLGAIAVAVEERLFELAQPPQVPLDLRLGEGIRLLGYDLPQPAVQPGDELALTLYWRCEAPLDTSYTVFVHLLDEQGQVQGQQDRLPSSGQASSPAPTTGWVSGQIVIDRYALPIAEQLPSGSYQLEIGMYNARDMTRLPVLDTEGLPLPHDRALLETQILIGSNTTTSLHSVGEPRALSWCLRCES